MTYEETVLDPVGHGIFIQKQGGHGQRRGGPSRPQRRGRGEGGGEEGLGQGEEGEDEGGGRELHGWLAATLCCCRLVRDQEVSVFACGVSMRRND